MLFPIRMRRNLLYLIIRMRRNLLLLMLRKRKNLLFPIIIDEAETCNTQRSIVNRQQGLSVLSTVLEFWVADTAAGKGQTAAEICQTISERAQPADDRSSDSQHRWDTLLWDYHSSFN
jgi:hypothetical protein